MDEKKVKRIIDHMPEKVKVYKVVAERISNKEYIPPYSILNSPSRKYIDPTPYKEGLNEAVTLWNIGEVKTDLIDNIYRSGFHFYKDKAKARQSARYMNKFNTGKKPVFKFKVVTCTVKKEWITAIGKQWGITRGRYDIMDSTAMSNIIVTNKVIFPKRRK